jgi:Protein of unknown function (DUF3108)
MVRIFLILLATTCAALCLRVIDVSAQSAQKQHPASAPVPSRATDIIESASHVQPPPPGYKFPTGQNYIFSGEWRLFNAGTATLHFENTGSDNHIVMTADATGAVALLYHVHDRMESVIDAKTFCSRSIRKHTEEGFRRVDTNLVIDYKRKKAFFDEKNLKNNSTRHAENDVPECVTDVISGIFYAGTVPAQPDGQFSFPLNDGGKTVDVLAHVEAREEIKVPAGTYKTIRIQPEVLSGPLKGKGKVWVWYSDDANHIPVQMRAKLFWGTLTFKLQRIEQATK